MMLLDGIGLLFACLLLEVLGDALPLMAWKAGVAVARDPLFVLDQAAAFRLFVASPTYRRHVLKCAEADSTQRKTAQGVVASGCGLGVAISFATLFFR